MLRVSYIYLLAIKVVGCVLVLSGCAFFGSEPTYSLIIENNSSVSITYCYWPDASSCDDLIPHGELMMRYYQHIDGGADGVLDAFGRRGLEICGKVVSIDELKAVSPIKHLKGRDYKIVIGGQVSDMYCHAGNG